MGVMTETALGLESGLVNVLKSLQAMLPYALKDFQQSKAIDPQSAVPTKISSGVGRVNSL